MKVQRDLVYVVDAWERQQFERLRNALPELDKVLSQGRNDYIYSFDAFGREVFNRLYSYGFCLRCPEILPEDSWAATLHAHLDGDQDFTYLAQQSVNDIYASGRATIAFLDYLLNHLPKPEKPITEDPQELREHVIQAMESVNKLQEEGLDAQAQSLLESLQPLIEKGKEAVRQHQEFASQISPNPVTPEDYKQAQAQTQAQIAAQAQAQVQGQTEGGSQPSASGEPGGQAPALEVQLSSAVADAIAAATASANKEVEESLQMQKTLGRGLDAGTGEGRMSLEEKIAIGKRLQGNRQLKAMVKLAGRMQQAAAKKRRTQSVNATNAIVSVENGRRVERLTSSEYLKLREPQLRPLFYKQYQAASLLQFKAGGKTRANKGPIVSCIDCSGSMGGSSDVWAKAVSLAMLGIAQQEKRNTRIIHFDTRVTLVDDFGPKDKGVKVKNRIIDSLAHFSGGGTDWEPPLNSAIQAVEKDGRYKEADIILITDGLSELSDSFVQQFKLKQKKHKFNLYVVIIDDSKGRYRDRWLGELKKITEASNIITVDSQYVSSEERGDKAAEIDQILSI